MSSFPTSSVFGCCLDCRMTFERTVPLHDLQELHNDLGARADEHLALASLLGVVDGIERIVEDGCLDHSGGVGWRFSRRGGGVRYLYVNPLVSLQEPWRAQRVPSGASRHRKGFFSSVDAGAAVSSSRVRAWMSAGLGYLKGISCCVCCNIPQEDCERRGVEWFAVAVVAQSFFVVFLESNKPSSKIQGREFRACTGPLAKVSGAASTLPKCQSGTSGAPRHWSLPNFFQVNTDPLRPSTTLLDSIPVPKSLHCSSLSYKNRRPPP